MNKKKVGLVIILVMITMVLVVCNNELKVKNNIQNISNKEELVYKDVINIESTESLPTISDYVISGDYSNLKITYKIDNEIIDENNLTIGTYDVYVNNKKVSILNINDSKAPILKLKNLSIKENEKYDISNFIVSCSDDSTLDCVLSYSKDIMANYNKVGKYEIEIVASDESNNKTIEKAVLVIEKDNINSNVTKVTSNILTSNNKTNTTNNKLSNKTSNKISNLTNNKVSNKVSNKNSNTSTKTSKNNVASLKNDANNAISKNHDSIYVSIIKETNDYRNKAGISSLVEDKNLSIAATMRAIEMAKANVFSHTRPDGRAWSTIGNDLGGINVNAENIASGIELEANEVVELWYESPTHYKNMMNSSYKKIGIGYYEINKKRYYVQLFSIK